MLQNCSLSRNRLFCVRGGGGILPLLFAFSLLCAALAFTGCEHDPGSSPFTDNHELNSGLIGTWKASGEDWSDTYTIKGGGISHKFIYNGSDTGSYDNAEIAYVYNFNRTSGCIIIKYTSGKYSAVYFKNLSKNTMQMGDAYDVSNPGTDVSVADLEEAQKKFSPANASSWGGADALMAAPQTRQG
ncbi:MAG: hypothetical protein LBK66_03335 [Spirochaetaceae bacterium]|jgi:hypothetical protein|nr:hypothetical protein [Spirochaetaceae bacterium]